MNSRRLHSIGRLTFGNRASQIYLALVAAATVIFLLGHSTDPFAGLWMYVVAMPTILVFTLAGSFFSGFDAMPSWFAYTSVVASVLIQSLCLGALVSRIRAGQRSPAQPSGK